MILLASVACAVRNRTGVLGEGVEQAVEAEGVVQTELWPNESTRQMDGPATRLIFSSHTVPPYAGSASAYSPHPLYAHLLPLSLMAPIAFPQLGRYKSVATAPCSSTTPPPHGTPRRVSSGELAVLVFALPDAFSSLGRGCGRQGIRRRERR